MLRNVRKKPQIVLCIKLVFIPLNKNSSGSRASWLAQFHWSPLTSYTVDRGALWGQHVLTWTNKDNPSCKKFHELQYYIKSWLILFHLLSPKPSGLQESEVCKPICCYSCVPGKGNFHSFPWQALIQVRMILTIRNEILKNNKKI